MSNLINHFYMTLPSNACLDKYPTNNQSNYTIQFPSPVEFQGNWEVALTEIHYPKTWKNLLKDDYFNYHCLRPELEMGKLTRLKQSIESLTEEEKPNGLYILELKFNS